MNPQLLRRILVSILSLTLVTACESIQAEELNVPKAQMTNGDSYGKPSAQAKEQITLGDSYGKLTDQGQSRTYYLYTPKSYNPDQPMPLVLVFHGDEGSGRSIADVTRFNDLAEKNGFIVVYPDAINHTWSFKAKPNKKVDDVLFVNALINHLEQVRNIDPQRIYATGFSKGAILTQALACKLPDKITAFASVAGALSARLIQKCQPQSPVSMLMINGTNDKDVHYDGDDDLKQKGALVSVPQTVNFWETHNQCKSATPTQVLAQATSSDGLKVKTAMFSGCMGGAEVVQLSVVDGGHFWPGGTTQDPQLKQVNNQLGFNASQAIWDFFQHHGSSSEVSRPLPPSS